MSEELEIEGEELPRGLRSGPQLAYAAGRLGLVRTRKRWRLQVSRAQSAAQFQIGPTQLHSADILGIFPRHLDDAGMTPYIAYPRVFALDDLGFPADRPLGRVRRAATASSRTPSASPALREYEPGDPLRRIDWKATARRGELQSRVYEPSAVQHLYVLLNIDTLEHSWEGYLKDDLERTVSMAASLAVWATGRRYAVRPARERLALPNSRPAPSALAPSRARSQLPRILETLAVVQPLTMGDLSSRLRRRGEPACPSGPPSSSPPPSSPTRLAEAMRRLQDGGLPRRRRRHLRPASISTS